MMMSIPEWINLIKKSFEDTKGIIRSSKSKKDRQYNSYKKKDKITENDHDTKNLNPWATWKPQKIRGGGGDWCSGKVSSSCPTRGIYHLTLFKNRVASHEWGKSRFWLRQTEHIRGHLWHRYSVTVNHVMATTIKLLK